MLVSQSVYIFTLGVDDHFKNGPEDSDHILA